MAYFSHPGHLLSTAYCRQSQDCRTQECTCRRAYLHENGCPWNWWTCNEAACHVHWDCLQYAVDNKCPEWEIYAKRHAEHLR